MKKYTVYLKIFGYIVSVFFLYLTFRNVNFSVVINNFKYINFYYISGALIFNVFFFILRGSYQKNNLKYIKSDLGLWNSITSVAIAQFYNVIFPARFGEILRSIFLSKKENVKKISILSYVFIEKILDLIIILFLLILLILFGFYNSQLSKVLISSLIVILFIFCLIFIYIRFNAAILKIVNKIIPKKIYEFIEKINISVLEGLGFYKSFKQVANGIFLLVSSWIMILGIFWIISLPYVKILDLPYYSCLFFMVFSALSLSVPSAPSGIGIVHYGLFLAVKILNGNKVDVNIDLIATFVIMLHFFIMINDLIIGGIIMLCNKLYSKSIFYKIKKNEK